MSDPATGFEDSWYHATAHHGVRHAALRGEIESDVCVIGAGYTGLSAALELARRGYQVAVLEAHRVGAGASGRNGGILGSGQRKEQDVLEARLGEDTARALWRIACDANQLVRDRVAQFAIDCDLKNGELTAAHRPRHERSLWAYADLLETRYGYPHLKKVDASEVRALLGTDALHGGYVDSGAGHLHPLNLALGLARAATTAGARIFEQTRATGYEVPRSDQVLVKTVHGRVRARYLVIACNGYLGNLEPAIDRYQMPINNFIIATAPLGEEQARTINRDDLAVIDTRFVVNYFHNSPDHRLIFGGGETYSSRFPADIAKFVRRRLREIYPALADVAIDYAWGGTLAVTLARMPHFGRRGPNVYWAQGYSGHGIAMANMGGKLVAEAIMGHAERFDLFAGLRHRPFPGGRALRWPALVAGMLYYSMLDRF